ncbi:MAG: class I SAM-dependent methyltransferase [Acidimicrobiia bacterium]|nr:class I SAM-dependent methyltransferase [Acidimicrobiia bacterium]
MVTDWDAHWWLEEVARDPTFEEEVLPLLIDLLDPRPEHLYLDGGCGEGQGMRTVAQSGARVIGCDLDATLLGHVGGPVVRSRLPSLGWLADRSVDGAFLVLVLEHLADHVTMFEEAARVVRPDGTLAIVSNHPAFTAPGAGPLIDPADGEVSWRWGRYLEPGTSIEPAGSFNLTMHHRSLGDLLSAAARAGWMLDRLDERGPGPAARDRDPLLAAQHHIPRLVGLRFRNARRP